ncbi:C4-dicarboxylate transport transcriptional regulatory protein DctD [Paraburkholderia caffeinitolerans]|uniref:C4-dicarboxylate transport transcriptional regulatory protein DctD n=1 Tax=Paraburkholderia caffeinitolerans TaxID=1723730 RepID=A0A6J5FXK5_9BURK|nr:response regulator [Paraburkholderia dokdonensis]CAB3787816.1 C4-dicarboxylate transport transcriptional regulatory protein DctD [Paraburkholderia caffeinitolerans]
MDDKRELIVIVEDDSGLRRAVERLLRLSGFRTRSFHSAEDSNVFEFASEARCLVIDVQLPGISGPAFYGTLHLPRPPAVFMTAYDGVRMRRAIENAGAHTVLTKPFLGDALIKEILKATGSPH